MSETPLQAERAHLSALLEAIQRCVFFLEASNKKPPWPLSAGYLQQNNKNIDLFESLAAINERFAKLQDTLGAAMRHAILLAGEPGETFLKVLAFYEKAAVIESIVSWQLCRTTRNLAAHDYGTDYAEIAEHCNALHSLIPTLYGDAARFIAYCHSALGIGPLQTDYEADFASIMTEYISHDISPKKAVGRMKTPETPRQTLPGSLTLSSPQGSGEIHPLPLGGRAWGEGRGPTGCFPTTVLASLNLADGTTNDPRS